MRVVIGVLADASGARALARAWLAAGCPRPRLHLYARADARLDAAPGDAAAPPLLCLARHGPVSLWALALAAGERSRSLRRQRRVRHGLALLYRLAASGPAGGWPAELHALADGRTTLGVVPLRADEADVVALARPLLAHASGPVRVRELPWETAAVGATARH